MPSTSGKESLRFRFGLSLRGLAAGSNEPLVSLPVGEILGFRSSALEHTPIVAEPLFHRVAFQAGNEML